MKKLLISASLIAFVVASNTLLFTSHSQAVTASDWKAGLIIDDGVFTNANDMSVADIQSFLNKKVPNCDTNGTQPASEYGRSDITHAQYAALKGWAAPPYVCLRNYYEVPKTAPGPGIPANNYSGSIPAGAISAAQMIYDAAQQYRINPKVLLVKLGTESHGPLTSDSWPLRWQYTFAMGAHCPDSGPGGSANCDTNYAGFSIQMREAASLLRWYLDGMTQSWWQYRKPYQVNSILWKPVVSGCGAGNVYIESKATAALYTYTPYQPNQAALNNMYGTGDGCSSYGNRNFWRVYSDWFGSTRYGNLVRTNGGGVYLIENGYKRAFPSEIVFQSYSYSWAKVAVISPSTLALIPDGAAVPYNTSFREGRLVSAPGQGVYLVDIGLKRPISSEPAFLSYKYKWYDVLSITPAELALIPDGAVISYNTHFRDGQLIKTPSGGIYLAENGLKRAIPSDTVFLSYAYKWSDALGVSNAELALIPDGTMLSYNSHYRDGKLLKSSNGGVYLVENGLKRPFPSDTVFLSYSYKWSDVLSITAAELALIPDGAIMSAK